MADSPIPKFHLLKSKSYASGCVQVTRGCSNRCTFCDIPVKYGNGPRSKKIEQVLEEIRILSELGHDSIFFVDDNFAGNREYAKELLREIAKLIPTLPTSMYFYTQSTLDVADDDELMALFRDAAFYRLFIGIETGNKDKLRNLNKRHQLDMDIKKAVDKITSYGITVWAGIMFGLEGDDKASFDEQIKFIVDTNFIPVQVGLLQAVPDTPLYKKSLANDSLKILPSIYGLTALSEEDVVESTNITPSGISNAELNVEFARVLRAMFSPEVFEKKMIKYIRGTSKGLMSTLPPLNLNTVMILARMVSYYLFKADSRTRKMFFKVLFALIGNKLKNLDETVFHILAYKHMQTHYFKIAEICEKR